MPKRQLKRARDRSREFRQDPDYDVLYQQAASEEIGATLQALRLAKGASQQDVAEAMGVTRSRISQIEGTEGTSLSLDVLTRYAGALGCTLRVALQSEDGTHGASLLTTVRPSSAFRSVSTRPYKAHTFEDGPRHPEGSANSYRRRAA